MAHPVDIHVGKRIRLRRSMLGMSQDFIGKEIGVTFQQIQKYERGVNRVGSSRLYDFSRILGVPVGYFFDDMDPETLAGTIDLSEDDTTSEGEKMSDKETIELVRSYYKITDPAIRRKVLSLIKAMGPA